MSKNNLEIKNNLKIIDEMFGDFAFFTDPKLLKDEFQGLINTKMANIEGINKYFQQLSNINYALRKTLKYEKYFEKFYPNETDIENFEALNHHIHAYLQDMDTLKNKIEVFLGEVKNDIKKVVANKDDYCLFIKAGISKTYEVFDNILKYRRQHVHNGMRFTDGDLLKAENAHNALEMFLNPVFDAMLNQNYKPIVIAKFERQKIESFKIAKERWIKTAQNNDIQTTGFVSFLLKTIQPSLYKFLEIESVQEIIAKSKNRNKK